MRWSIAILLLSTCCLPGSGNASQSDVTVYRCTDARGQVELRDTPCNSGQRQQVREMMRPRDPLPGAAAPAIAPPQREQAREVHYVFRQPARPLYECTAPDGSVYTSENDEGNARWQPGWIAAPPWGMRPPIVALGGAHVQYRDRHASVRIGRDVGVITYPGGVYPGIAYGGATWVRDSCMPMPQERMCATLVQQRDDIRRRNVLRQPSEQSRLDAEESSINARLRDECGG